MRVLKIFLSALGTCVIALALWKVPAYQVRVYRANDQPTNSVDKENRLADSVDKEKRLEHNREILKLELEHNRELFKLENDLRSNYAQLIGGVVLLIGLYLTWRKQNHEERISNHTLRLTEDGKITERYSKAIELIGSDNQAVRIGGIYALERIARDSEKDHWTVMEALCAFIRDESNKTSAKADPAPPISKSSEGEGTNLPSDTKIRSDIQIGLTVVGRRSWHDTESAQKLRIDLSGANLSRADLSKANLRKANLSGAKLDEADLREAKLGKADLISAGLSYADLSGADLREAKLFGANLIGADLRGADLDEADLREAKLIRAKYNKDTVFPTGFNSDNKEMIMID